jgi:hypothetical protein
MQPGCNTKPKFAFGILTDVNCAGDRPMTFRVECPQCRTRKPKSLKVYEFTLDTGAAIPLSPRFSRSVQTQQEFSLHVSIQLRPIAFVSSGDRTDRVADSPVHITDDPIGPRLVDRFGHTVLTMMAPSATVVLFTIDLEYKCDPPHET